MDKGKLDYSLSSTGLLIDIRDMDLVSGDEAAEVQKLNPCGCDVWCTCRTGQNHAEHIRNVRTIPASEPSSGPMFTATLTLKQWNSAQVKCNILFCLLSVRQLIMQHRDYVCLIFLQKIKNQILLELSDGHGNCCCDFNASAELGYGSIRQKNLMFSSLFPKNAHPLSKRRHRCCAAPKTK